MKTELGKLNEIKEQIKEAVHEQKVSTSDLKERERFLNEDFRDKHTEQKGSVSPRRNANPTPAGVIHTVTEETTTTTPVVQTLPATSSTFTQRSTYEQSTPTTVLSEPRPEGSDEAKRLQTILDQMRSERQKASLEVSQMKTRSPGPSRTQSSISTTTVPRALETEIATTTSRSEQVQQDGQTVEMLRTRILELETQLSNEKERATEQEREVHNLRQNLRVMSNDFDTLRTELASLQSNSTATREGHDTLTRQISDLDNTIQQLRSQNSEQIVLRDTRIRELTQQLEEAERKNEQLRAEGARLLMENQNQINDLTEQLQRTIAPSTSTTSSSSTTSIPTANSKRGVNDMYYKQLELEDFKTKLKDMQKERENKQKESKQKAQQLKEFEDMLKDKEKEIEAMKVELMKAKESKNTAIENTVRESAQQTQKERHHLHETLGRQSQLVEEYKAKIYELETHMAHDKSQEEANNKEIMRLIQHIEDMDSEVYETYKQLEREKNEEISRKNQEIQTLTETVADLHQQIITLRDSPLSVTLSERLVDKETQFEKLRRESNQQLSSQQRQINELQSRLQELENERNQVQVQKAQAERSVAQKEKEKRKESHEVHFRQVEIEELKGKLKDLQTEKENRQKESKQKSEKMREYEQLLEEKEKEMESIKLSLLRTKSAKNSAIENKERELKQLTATQPAAPTATTGITRASSQDEDEERHLGLAVEELKSKILELELTLHQEKAMEEDKEQEVKRLTQQIQDMDEEVYETYKELEREKGEEILHLKQSLESANKRLSELESQLAQQSAQLQERQNEVERLRAQVTRMGKKDSNEVHFKEVELDELQTKMQQIQREKEMLIKEIKQKEDVNQQNKLQLEDKEREIESLKIELLHKEGSKIATLESKEREIIQTTQKQQTQTQTELERTRVLSEVQRADRDAVIQSLHAQIEELKQEGRSLLSARDSQIEQLTRQLRTQKEMAEAERHQLERKLKENEKEANERHVKMSEIDQMQVQLRDMQGDRERYQMEIDQRGLKIKEFERLLEEKEKEMDGLKLLIRHKEGEKFTLIENKEREIVKTGQEKEVKSVELNKALMREGDYLRAMEQNKERMRSLEEEVSHLTERHMEEKQSLISSYQDQILRLSQRVGELMEQNTRQQEEISRVQQREMMINNKEKEEMEDQMQIVVNRLRDKEVQVNEKNNQLNQISSLLSQKDQQQQHQQQQQQQQQQQVVNTFDDAKLLNKVPYSSNQS